MGRARFTKGEEVIFTAAKGGRRFKAVVTAAKIVRGNIAIQLTGDPYPVTVNANQVTKENEDVPASEARKLRKEAEALGVEGINQMGGKELAAAVEAAKERRLHPKAKTGPKPSPAAIKKAQKAEDDRIVAATTIGEEPPKMKTKKKPTVKKAAAKKTAPAKKAVKKPVAAKVAPKKAPAKVAKKSAATPRVATAANPFRPGSNLFKMTEELLKGGKRVEMIRRLRKTMGIHPWSKDKEENPEKAIDKRLLITAGTLKKDFGYRIETEGRGSSGTIQVFPPGAKKTAGQTAKKKASSSKTTKKPARRK